MRMSKLFVETLREFPADAEVASHKLLVRAGFIRKLTSGVYTYLPLMWKVLKKVEKIIREEMDKSGAQELLMPIIQPRELWEESGRWSVYGKELMRFQDRHEKMLALGPTHEEVVTFVAREGIRSYRQLPVNLYQIQNKYRDEIRPRFGLLRGREFIMKDAYSFDATVEGMEKSYEIMADVYKKIFTKCGLETRMVRSDSGAIGGSLSHEFMVLVDTNSGEDDVIYCSECDYASNTNFAASVIPEAVLDGGFSEFKLIDTPNIKTIEELSEFLKIPQSAICKSLVYIIDDKPVLALIRGDKTVEETKLKNAVGGQDIRIASCEEITELMQNSGYDAQAGFIGPKGLKCKIIADLSVKDLKNFVTGANQNDVHYVGVSWGADIDLPETADIRLAQAGEFCPVCNKTLKISQGIEVGNIFQLGTKYSAKMKAVFCDEDGKEKPFIMGCYGIGVSRTAAAAVEKFHDDFGIKWPKEIAPFHVVIVPVNTMDEAQMAVSEKMYEELSAQGIEVLFDDRDERAGVKFKDADLIGFPVRITAGKTVAEGLVEYKIRETGEVIKITPEQAVQDVIKYIRG
ncbi:MAG: proline--tRNA ligase [Candidatus Gastranaerophilales bacterium]|nr:proline--tRNA ligase [Candidatus Gastranaerophilales bacterium]